MASGLIHSMALIEEESDMDIVWLAAGALFFIGSFGFARFVRAPRVEERP